MPDLIDRIWSQAAEIERLRRFVADHSTTCYSCEACGHARTTRECLWCENGRLRTAVNELEEAVSAAEIRANERGTTIHWLRNLCGEADDWIGELDRRGDYIDERWRLRAASKGEA